MDRIRTAIDACRLRALKMVQRPRPLRARSSRDRAVQWVIVVGLVAGLWPAVSVAHFDALLAHNQRAQEAPEPTQRPTCADGRLRIADLPAIQDGFEAGVEAERVKAQRWQDDARLVGLRVGCRLLDDGFNWRGIYFSDAIQTYFFSDTGETRTVDVVAPPGPTLPLTDVDFRELHQALLLAGFEDSTELNPSSNVEIRLNSAEAPFGPPNAPRDEVYFHVAIEYRGDVIDLFVSAKDGTPYQFQT